MEPTPEQLANRLRDSGLSSPQQANVSAGKLDPTIATSPVRRYTEPSTPSRLETEREAAYGPGGVYDRTQPDEAKIRESMRSRVQEQVDAITNTYAGILSREAVRGTDRAGQTRSINARSGILGSDFGDANKAATEKTNEAAIRAIEAERDLNIQSVLSKVEDRTIEKVQREKDRALKGTEEWIKYLESSQNEARTDALTLAKSGASLQDLTDQEYANLLEQTGYDENEIDAIFKLNKPKDQVVTSFTQGNQYFIVSKDPITGQNKTDKIDLGFEVPQGYKQSQLDDGTVLFYPEKFDPNKDIKDQILTYGVFPKKAGSTETVKSGTMQVSQEDIAQGNTLLQQNRGSDNYVNTGVYVKMYETWVANGGLPADFFKYYPKTYLNPKDPTLPVYLKEKSSSTGA